MELDGIRFSDQDIERMKTRGMTPETIVDQIKRLTGRRSSLKISAPARVGDGIIRLSETEKKRYRQVFFDYASQSGTRIGKFVPASGAASRMFGFLSTPQDPQYKRFFQELNRFPFQQLWRQTGVNDPRRLEHQEIIRLLLDELRLARLPKALLPFHQHQGLIRTPLHEHSAELISMTASGRLQDSLLHLTINPEYQPDFIVTMNRVSSELGAQIPFSLSRQMPHTDTVAVDESGALLRDGQGEIVFRPGGHGALIHNLDQLEAGLIFIKNIDNVPHPEYPDYGKPEREAMAGLLIEAIGLRNRTLQAVETAGRPSRDLSDQLITAARKYPGFLPDTEKLLGKRDYHGISHCLDRPVRVCGIVQNQGEPGGGPFWVLDRNGQNSLQIIEQAQIDRRDPSQVEFFSASTHFNPVDMVCCRLDRHGRPYPLSRFIDSEQDFVSSKPYNGKKIRVLEHPGLWNGAMAGWLTLFVEIDARSFCPVKTVNDLLRPAHQPAQAEPL